MVCLFLLWSLAVSGQVCSRSRFFAFSRKFPCHQRDFRNISRNFPISTFWLSATIPNEGPLPADALLVLMEAVGRSFSNDTCGN